MKTYLLLLGALTWTPSNVDGLEFSSLKVDGGGIDGLRQIGDDRLKRWFEQRLDHFDLMTRDAFMQKYYLNDTFWKQDGPIFLTPGGEGPINGLPYQLGRDLAKRFGGMYVALEHRFYGESVPFGGNKTAAFESKTFALGKLSVEQAVADAARFIGFLKQSYHSPNSKVIAFGGSYSGKLSAYLRYSHPHLCDGALASSAPVYLDGVSLGVSQYKFYEIVTSAADRTYPGCSSHVRNALSILDKSPLEEITSRLPMCQPLESREELVQFVRVQFSNFAMANYPPNSNTSMYYGCLHLAPLSSDKHPLDVWSRFFELKSGKCLNLRDASASIPSRGGKVMCGDFSGCGTGWAGEAWDYQSTTQVVQPIGTNNVSDMFPPKEWTLEWMETHAKTRFSYARVDGSALSERYGLAASKREGANKYFTNVIWSNGLQDPWSAGGVFDSKYSIVMENGAHHSELNSKGDEFDTDDIIRGRQLAIKYIAEFLNRSNNP
mmetsp:Transcript_12165/g.19768  ORF Transcript_12165/g.19768 Transcript_12165/m.19768 type:complete len:491 (+) Transcript_12165:104-1576(+)